MSAALHPAPEMVRLGLGDFLFGSVMFVTAIVLGLLALIRTERFIEVRNAFSLFPPGPGPTGTRVVGVLFVLGGTFLLGFYIFSYYFR